MKRSNIKTTLAIFTAIFLFSQVSIFSQASEAELYNNAKAIRDPHQKIEALRNFLVKYPDSHNSLGARYYIFMTYVDLKSEKGALDAAQNLLNNSSGGTQISLYNTVASSLAESKMALKEAKEYIDTALVAMEGGSPRYIRNFKDTKALVVFNLGYPDSALALEKEAMVGNEKKSGFLNSLSVYQNATGHKDEALTTAAKSVLYGNTDESISNFSKWLDEYKSGKQDRADLRNNITNKVLGEFIKDSGDENQAAVNSNAAAFLARMKVDLSKAEKWAVTAVKKINKETSIDDIITYRTNLAIVYSELNKNQKALKELTSVEDFVDPWTPDFWNVLGMVYEKLGQNDKAMNAYVSGLIAYKPDMVLNSAKALAKKEGKAEGFIDKEIDRKEKELKEFEPGKFDGKNSTGRVVLAELFTGAECPPCVGADLAFDKLSEYYPKDVFAVLEYHVHIPGPDPLTNPQTFQRYKYYGGNFGTPTVFFDGGNQLIGGGPDILKANRFKVYNYIIKQQLGISPEIKIKGSAKVDGNIVDVKVELSPAMKDKNLMGKSLHIALAERSVSYTGGNGVSKQIFVVRHLVDGPEGSPVNFGGKSVSVSKTIDLAGIEKTINTYLDDPTKDPSWRGGKTVDWRARPEKINPHNLAVVIWVQDNTTKQIAQAFYTNVSYKMSSK
jgi:predicted Zn-dependent protease